MHVCTCMLATVDVAICDSAEDFAHVCLIANVCTCTIMVYYYGLMEYGSIFYSEQ